MNWLAVAFGGSLGAVLRYAVAIGFPHSHGKFPLATFFVNVAGSFLMGALFIIIIEKAVLPLIFRQVVMVGFLGAFTTFSTFSLESLQLLHSGHVKMAIVNAVLSVLASIFAAFCGFTIFKHLM